MTKPIHPPNRCPVCLSGRWVIFSGEKRFQVACRKCKTRGPETKTEEEAISEWNSLAKQKTIDEIFGKDTMAKSVYNIVFSPRNTVDICKKIVSIIEYYRK